MRINGKTIPSLNYLNLKKIGGMPVVDGDQRFFRDAGGSRVFGDIFFRHVPNFRRRIFVVSKRFMEAAAVCSDQLIDLYKDIATNDLSDFQVSGTFVYGDKVFMIDHEIRKGEEKQRFALFIFDTKTGAPLSFYEDDFTAYKGSFGWISQHFARKLNQEDSKQWIMKYAGICVVLEMFKQYAQVETVLIKPNKKEVVNQEGVLNETSFDVTYLDSKWFTNIIRSDGFSVRGHFRLQPKKVNGEWTRELIWISEFQKHGYVHKARILTQDQ